MALVVVTGAVIKCKKGSAPSPLNATSASSVAFTTGCAPAQVATELDHLPGVNFQPFGQCSIDGKPCQPITPSPWTISAFSGAIGVHMAGHPLTQPCTLNCTRGGVIEILNPGQGTVDSSDIYAPPRPKNKSFLEKVGGVAWDVVTEAAPTAFSYVPVVGQLPDVYNIGKAVVTLDERALGEAVVGAVLKRVPVTKKMKEKAVKGIFDKLGGAKKARTRAETDVGPPKNPSKKSAQRTEKKIKKRKAEIEQEMQQDISKHVDKGAGYGQNKAIEAGSDAIAPENDENESTAEEIIGLTGVNP